jgi:hypothetical protein
MRPDRRSLLAAAVIATLAPACAEQASAPSDPGAPELATRIDHGNIWVDFFLADVDNPCTPEVEAVDLTGRIHGVGSSWDNDHFLSHYDVNLSGVDADGVRYQGASTGNGNVGSPIEDMVISTVINSTGGDPNFTTKIVLQHLKDGTVTVDKAGDECRG